MNPFHQNDKPVDDFEGLTPNEMHFMLYRPLEETVCPLRFKPSAPAELLDSSPLFLLYKLLLKEVAGPKGLKLTPAGYLPPKICQGLYDLKLFDDEMINKWKKGKIRSEIDWKYAIALRLILEYGKVCKKRHKVLSVTKAGAAIMASPYTLFKDFLFTFATKVNWGYFDGYPPHIGQFGFAYSLYLLRKYGDQERPVGFYSSLVLKAFPALLSGIPVSPYGSSPEAEFRDGYAWRFFDLFTQSTGLTEATFGKELITYRVVSVKKTPLFDAVLQFDRSGGRWN